jgi:hypothetical protein
MSNTPRYFPARSARGDNFFSVLPAGILEREILSRLSQPETASLIIAVGLTYRGYGRKKEMKPALGSRMVDKRRKVGGAEMLRAGQIPDDIYLAHIANARIDPEQVPLVREDVFLRFILGGIPRVISAVSAEKLLTEHYGRYGIHDPLSIGALMNSEVYLKLQWHRVDMAVYRIALALGYVWALRDSVVYINLNIARWDMLIADFTPRLEQSPSAVITPWCGMHFADAYPRIRGMIVLFGDVATATILTNCSKMISAAWELKRILGDARFHEAVLKSDCGIYLHIATGGDYESGAEAAAGFDTYPLVTRARECRNISFFRGILKARFEELRPHHSRVCANCIAFGEVAYLDAALEQRLTINPKDLHKARINCTSVPMLERIAELK